MKIVLINPVPKISRFTPQGGFLKRLLNKPQLTLPYLAALTPPDVEVVIANEPHYAKIIDYDMEADLIGITVMSHVAKMAYEIADEFRKRGVPVVLGGIHPTALPNEAITHADAVVLGEAEGVWEQLIRDCQNGRMKRFYSRENRHSLKNLPIPRWDLVDAYKFIDLKPIQASRGCPFRCEFCSISIAQGRQYRFRPVEDVINEIEVVGSEYWFMVDDNIVGHQKYSKELFKGLSSCKIKWGSSAAMNIIDNKELLPLLKKSGCMSLDIGFESISEGSLKEMGKRQNRINRYNEVIKNLHDYGILVYGNFIFGFDNDNEDIFKRTFEFILKSRLDAITFFILTPYPGTPFYQRMKEEKRLFNENWWMGNVEDFWMGNHFSQFVSFEPMLMSSSNLWKGYLSMPKKCYEFNSILKRIGGRKRTDWTKYVNVWALNFGIKEWFSLDSSAEAQLN